ncbi:BZ3500_MvSof-1268-A1-R1_Chr11-2g03394 [Microbotryum saponariae]|uniref:BZ3500_MvSof-1268-A1-R1_Chr11-2g03394 protein n=1 Tax=Microbotryum saponariae TaxID=289078 RepID=A0A2X0KQU8_9BASI|nr:BZ3500_MvSof-1268-A1-R1_Chr11-2g03394 [Microbotryum saponariae]SDA03279.1 BZ3501_MvSof-1269-A2-R1_Chr11g02965 [Microbotryum saponariae]
MVHQLEQLDRQLNEWLQAVGPDNSKEPNTPTGYPIEGCKAVIAPHAGYAYSGPAAAWAYRCIDAQHIKRIFILGPSHHVALPGCALSQCDEYATPLGPLKLDKKTIAELAATGKFEWMDQQTDEDEHRWVSLGVPLPSLRSERMLNLLIPTAADSYVRKILEGRSDITLIPILVGSLSFTSEKTYGTLLEPYLRSADTLFVISSDFCHWGTRFGYTYFIPRHDLGVGEGHALSRGSSLGTGEGCCSIDQSIERLDREGMRIITFDQNGEEEGGRTPRSAHEEFNAYLKQTRNTICGRHPIGVLLGAMTRWAEREVEAEEGSEGVGGGCRLVWTRYEQSERVKDLRGSSVSYASAFVGLSE